MSFEVKANQYGFSWGPILVERTASNHKSPKWLVLRVYDWKGKVVEIHLRPRSTTIVVEKVKNK